jgi:hypothetical protein
VQEAETRNGKTNLLLTKPGYLDQQKTEHDPGSIAPKAQDARTESVGIDGRA